MHSTARFVNHHFISDSEKVGFVRDQTTEFEARRPRGYAATGCLLEGAEGNPILAFNDIPVCAEDEYSSTPRGVERAAKFAALGHAEVNAIAFAAQHGIVLKGGTMTLAWFPCINCADAIVKAGIKRLIATQPSMDYKPDQYDFQGAFNVLSDAGVQISLVK